MGSLRGIYAASVTLFTSSGREVDAGWIPKHLRYLEGRGADGVVALSTNGEGPSLSVDERREVIDVVLESRGRLGVIIGTGTPALPDTVAVTRYALERGADAVMIGPPVPLCHAQELSSFLIVSLSRSFCHGLYKDSLDCYNSLLERLPANGREGLLHRPGRQAGRLRQGDP